jgi:hypothetical protein
MYYLYTDRDLMALYATIRELILPYYPIPPGRKIDPGLAQALPTVIATLERAMSAYRAKLVDLEQQQRQHPTPRRARRLAHC